MERTIHHADAEFSAREADALIPFREFRILNTAFDIQGEAPSGTLSIDTERRIVNQSSPYTPRRIVMPSHKADALQRHRNAFRYFLLLRPANFAPCELRWRERIITPNFCRIFGIWENEHSAIMSGGPGWGFSYEK